MVKYIFTEIRIICYHLTRKSKGGDSMDNKVLTIFDVANYFRSKEEMTHKKLQKLVYYAYAWYIALYNENKDEIKNKLCDDATFEAWVHGPVCKKLYDVYSNNYGQVEKYDGDINPLITGELKKFLDNIYKTFGKYSGDELESMTHREMPWQNARNTLAPYMPSNEVISEEDMFVYYNSKWVRKNQKLLINQNQWFK